MKEKKLKYTKFIVLGIALMSTSAIIYKTTKKEQVNDISLLEPLIEERETEEKEVIQEKIKIDIKGEVTTPGVYELNKGDRVSDAIIKAGGLTENADTNLINLSKNLTDEMVIIIYNKYEIEKLKQELTTTKTVIEYIEKECFCPDTINEACINESLEESKTETNTKQELSTDNKISINTASLEELQTLPGIGESKAKAIIKYREENNGFKSTDEITNISGIGTSTFEKFKDYITI